MAEFDKIVNQVMFRVVDSRKPHIWEMPKHYNGTLPAGKIPCRWCAGKSVTWKHLIGLARAVFWIRKHRD